MIELSLYQQLSIGITLLILYIITIYYCYRMWRLKEKLAGQAESLRQH